MRQTSALFFYALLIAGCATPAAVTSDSPPAAPGNPDYDGSAHLADMTAFSLIYTDGGATPARTMTVDQAADILSGFDVIFIGEMHRHPGSHLAEMQLFRAIHERAPDMSLSMEHFERDTQPVVDDYLASRIGESPFIQDARAWANYRTSYRPLVEYAKRHGLAVIAANAPEDVVRCVGLEGAAFLDRMSPDQRGWAAATLSLGDGPYRDKFMGFVQGDAAHGGDPDAENSDEIKPPSDGALRSYAAQVTRDDTMAESITAHLAAHPGRKVVHLNGSFHSDSFLGTVERVQARAPGLKIAVVNPVTIEHGTDFILTPEDEKSGTFVLLLQELPEAYATDEEMNAAIKRQMEAREKRVCEL